MREKNKWYDSNFRKIITISEHLFSQEPMPHENINLIWIKIIEKFIKLEFTKAKLERMAIINIIKDMKQLEFSCIPVVIVKIVKSLWKTRFPIKVNYTTYDLYILLLIIYPNEQQRKRWVVIYSYNEIQLNNKKRTDAHNMTNL